MPFNISLPDLIKRTANTGFDNLEGKLILKKEGDITFNAQLKQKTQESSGYQNIRIYNEDEVKTHGKFTLPVFLTVTLSNFDESPDDGLTLNTVLVEFSLQKNIVKTAVQGRAGTVKECISNGDWAVSISGLLVSDDKTYPQAEVNKLTEYATSNQALVVTNDLFSQLGINNLVIEEYNLPTAEGFINVQPFELSCVSDDPFELKLKKDKEALR